jgi:hypothetical protein
MGIATLTVRQPGFAEPLLLLSLILGFAGIDSENRICRTEAHDCGYQRDGRNDQRNNLPYHSDRRQQTYKQQHNPKHDATGTINSAYIAFHDDLQM